MADVTERLVRRPELLKITGLCYTSYWKLEQKGEAPKGFLLTPRCKVWSLTQVLEWVEARKKAPAQGSVTPLRAKQIAQLSDVEIARQLAARISARPEVRAQLEELLGAS